MKRKTLISLILVTLLLTTACITLVACNSSLTINFDVDGVIYETQTVESESDFVQPKDPVKECYKFDGWYWDKGTWKKPATIESAKKMADKGTLTCYAKFDFVSERTRLTIKNGEKLRVLQIADVQVSNEGGKLPQKYKTLLQTMIEDSKPNFIVLTGDNTGSEMIFSKKTMRSYHENIADFIGSFGIPWTTVFGNHDAGGPTNISQKELYDCYVGHPYFWGGYESTDVYDIMPMEKTSVANISIPVVNEDGELVTNLLCLDTEESLTSGGYVPLKPSQIEFYKQQADKLKAENNGKPVPQMLFTHQALPLYYYMIKLNNPADHKDLDKRIPQAEWDKVVNNGASVVKYTGKNEEKNEYIGFPKNAFDFQNEMLKRKDIKAVFVGHDHLSYCAGLYKPFANNDYKVMLAMSRQSGFGCSWYGGMSDNFQRGGRVIDVEANGHMTTQDLALTNIDNWKKYKINYQYTIDTWM